MRRGKAKVALGVVSWPLVMLLLWDEMLKERVNSNWSTTFRCDLAAE